MFSFLRKRFYLTDNGVRAAKLGTLWTTLANLVTMAGMGALYLAMAGFVDHLTKGAPLPELAPYLVGLAVFFALLVLCNIEAYQHTYGDFFQEAGQQRIAIAEHLRCLPLSFFGRRDVADLTETILTDVATMEHAFSHVLGELLGALASTAVTFVICLFFDWRLALAAFWSVPVAFALLLATRGPMRPVFDEVRVQKVVVSDGIQETLDCVREIRATNQEAAYLERLFSRIDESERVSARGEVVNGLIVNSGYAVLRLGLATTLVAGAALVAAGSVDFLTMFAFLLVVSRLYAPFDQALCLLSELIAAEAASRRMKDVMDEPPVSGSEAFVPQGHDVAFDHVSFSYADGGEDGRDGERVLSDVSFVAREGESAAWGL